jgi:hypothetical protein
LLVSTTRLNGVALRALGLENLCAGSLRHDDTIW